MQAQRRTLLAGAAAWAAAAAGSALPRAAVAADLPTTIAAAKPSVLPVGTYNATDSPRFGFRGTGFVVGDGSLLVTNFHVIAPGSDADTGPQMAVLAGRGEGNVRRAKVVATDRYRDLALLQLEGAPLPAMALEAAGQAREGQSIVLMGFPVGGVLGFAPVTHRGIIASITTVALPATTARQLDPRAVLKLREGNFDVFQLDAIAYPGNSGGPVIDVDSGRVVAVVNMVLVKGSRESALTNPTGITYAVPVQHVHELLRSR